MMSLRSSKVAARNPEETTAWVASKLKAHSAVETVEQIGAQTLRIMRKEYGPVVVGVISVPCVEVTTVTSFLAANPEVDFIANIPKESYWTGPAIQEA